MGVNRWTEGILILDINLWWGSARELLSKVKRTPTNNQNKISPCNINEISADKW